jgi:hypothetical protein
VGRSCGLGFGPDRSARRVHERGHIAATATTTAAAGIATHFPADVTDVTSPHFATAAPELASGRHGWAAGWPDPLAADRGPG